MVRTVVKIFGLGVFFVAALGGQFAVTALMEPSKAQKKAKLEQSLQAMVEAQGKALPNRLDAATTLVKVAAKGSELTYTFTVTDEHASEARHGGYLREERLTKLLCATEARELVRAVARFTYEYKSMSQSEVLGATTIRFCF